MVIPDPESVDLSTVNGIFPAEVQVFKNQDSYYAFDVRNFSILKLDDKGASVLLRMHKLPLEAIIREPESEIDATIVQVHYLRFLELMQDGTLSDRPVPSPGRPLFSRLYNR
jgi:hypothetical protein